MGIYIIRSPTPEFLFTGDVKRNWAEFKEKAINHPQGLTSDLTTSTGETPFHIAVTYGEVEFLRSIVSKMEKMGEVDWVARTLKIRNEDGYTPLHLAALMGNVDMCDCIAGVSRSLLDVRNYEGETPLFSAALQGKTDAFLLLHNTNTRGVGSGIGPPDLSGCRRTLDGDTILHCAIAGEHFDLAYVIIRLYKDLVWHVNERGETPLHILASKPSAFRSGSSLGYWKRIIYNGLSVVELKPDIIKEHKIGMDRSGHITGNKRAARVSFIVLLFKIFRQLGPIAKIREEKQKHAWACQIMNILLSSKNSTYEHGSGARPLHYEEVSTVPAIPYVEISNGSGNVQVTKERPFFIAARHGITEMVEEVLKSDSMAIDYVNQDHKNVLVLAVENRITDVLVILLEKYRQRPSGLTAIDDEGNSVLHLAAMLPENNPWPVPGATLQMQWEVKWFMFIKEFLSDDSSFRYNKRGETPEDLFGETHKELVNNSIKWLTSTSQACSVVAGLFVTIAYPTSTAVPGGQRQETGTPYMENHPAFTLFAISSQVAFYSSLFAVVVFLAILTPAGYQMSDFQKALPRKLLLGLTALYVSIASTLMSFCSAHFFVLQAKLKHAAPPVYIAMCLLVTLLSIAQFPLYLQLVWATFKKVPQRRSMRLIPQYLFY